MVAVEPSFLFAKDTAGVFTLGMLVDDVYDIVGRENVTLVATFPELKFQPALRIRVRGGGAEPSIVANISDVPCGSPRLSSIEVRDARYRTGNGLGVGSTLGVLKQRYPGSRVRDIDKDGLPNVFVKELKLAFAFDVGACDGRRGFPDTCRVTSVFIGPDLDAVKARYCPDR